jgi:hypothetical protein
MKTKSILLLLCLLPFAGCVTQLPDVNFTVTSASPSWSNYDAYLHKLTTTVQHQWENILLTGHIQPEGGTTVTVAFVIDSEGHIARIENVETQGQEMAGNACVSAITDRAAYGRWTPEMIAAMGKEQRLIFVFNYH